MSENEEAILEATRLALQETVGPIIEAVGVLQAHKAVIDWELAKKKCGDNTFGAQGLVYSEEDNKRLRRACSTLEFLKKRSKACMGSVDGDAVTFITAESRKGKRGRPMGSKNKISQPDNSEPPKTIASTPTVFFHQWPEAVSTYDPDVAKKLKRGGTAENTWREHRPHLEALPQEPLTLPSGSSSESSFNVAGGRALTSISYRNPSLQGDHGDNPHNHSLSPVLQYGYTGNTASASFPGDLHASGGIDLNIANFIQRDPRFQRGNLEADLPRIPVAEAGTYGTDFQSTSTGGMYSGGWLDTI